MTRREERRAALDVLFEADATGRAPVEVMEEWTGLGQQIPGFAHELVAGVQGHFDELDARIGAAAEGWTVPRMAAVDRAILRLATYEVLHRPDVPVAAAIDEAVELAKELSTEDSSRFVNGVLGKIARDSAAG
ncbi:MAG TPA: transcription antitermination factor NusB [Actinomycetota bacterium]|nr:transcription antitermination factor NusB [Actinomycetota bacterium]